MTKLRLGTRGSDLALTQSRWVCDQLRNAHSDLEIEEIIIKTHGDAVTDRPFGEGWPVGSFVGAIEQALIENRVDFAVHSFKDLQTAETAGLVVAAVPDREDVCDMLLTAEPVADVRNLPTGFRVGTASPRRSAQMRVLCPTVELVPIRGNVPTRINKIESENLDGVILAAAGLKRLGIEYPNMTPLPVDVFVPSPAQGALAIQVRRDTEAESIVSVMDHAATHRAVVAERAFLAAIEAGCHTPAGALATMDGDTIAMHAQLFDDEGLERFECHVTGDDADALGADAARHLLSQKK